MSDLVALATQGTTVEAMAERLGVSSKGIRLRLARLVEEAERQSRMRPPGAGKQGYVVVVLPMAWRGQKRSRDLVAAIGWRRTGRRLMGWAIVPPQGQAKAAQAWVVRWGQAKPVGPGDGDWLLACLGATWKLARGQKAIERRLWLLMARTQGWKLT